MMQRALVFILANAALFQIGWFVCVLKGNYWAGVFTGALLVLHFYFSPIRKRDAISVFVAVPLGVAHDYSLMQLGLVEFAESSFFPPLWLNCLWVLFAITLNHSLLWLYKRRLFSSAMGCIAGPLTYLAGVQLSSAQWSSPLVEVIPIIAGLWLFILPLHRLLCLRIEAYAHEIHSI